MPSFVLTDECDGGTGQERTACSAVCPHDPMHLDADGSNTGHDMRAINQEPGQSWECYACVEVCPHNAIEVRHDADIVPLGASVQPERGTDSGRSGSATAPRN